MRRSRSDRPCGCRRSSPTLRLCRPRCSTTKFRPDAPGISPLVTSPRIGSPVFGCSILMISAPQSPNTVAAEGTNPHSATSSTRIPDSTASMPPLLARRRPEVQVPSGERGPGGAVPLEGDRHLEAGSGLRRDGTRPAERADPLADAEKAEAAAAPLVGLLREADAIIRDPQRELPIGDRETEPDLWRAGVTPPVGEPLLCDPIQAR